MNIPELIQNNYIIALLKKKIMRKKKLRHPLFIHSIIALWLRSSHRRCFIKKEIIPQNSLEKTCTRVRFFNKVVGLRSFGNVWILQNF